MANSATHTPSLVLLTQYSTSVQPSMVIHWNTVSIAKAKLSKLVIPPLGPTQPLLHSVPLAVHWRPFPENAHGAGSSSATISAGRASRVQHSAEGVQEIPAGRSQERVHVGAHTFHLPSKPPPTPLSRLKVSMESIAMPGQDPLLPHPSAPPL